jgi:hypothetical protein
MLDLIFLAFETDTTRVAAYQLCAEDRVGICDRFPSLVGIGSGGPPHRRRFASCRSTLWYL